MHYGIFNVRTYVNVCDCTRGCSDTVKRVCTESWLWKKNPLPHREIEPAFVRCSTNWATSTPLTGQTRRPHFWFLRAEYLLWRSDWLECSMTNSRTPSVSRRTLRPRPGILPNFSWPHCSIKLYAFPVLFLSPDRNFSGGLGSKHLLTNSLTNLSQHKVRGLTNTE